MPQDAQCYVFDFTEPADGLSVDDLHRRLRAPCKKYCFQLERGSESTEAHPEGYLHYQGRVSFYKKYRPNEAITKWHELGFVSNISVTSGDVARKGDNFYVMKDDGTFVDGPWKDTDYVEPPPMTRQIKIIEENGLFPWQESIKQLVVDYDPRSIHMVIDPRGNHGKSAFLEWMEYKGYAYEIPTMRLMEEIMQCCMCIPKQNCYMIDMPRAMKKDRLADFFSGIETLKNGVMYDKRYHFKKRRIERPQIVVFSNTKPDISYLSRDRWRFWTIVDNALQEC